MLEIGGLLHDILDQTVWYAIMGFALNQMCNLLSNLRMIDKIGEKL